MTAFDNPRTIYGPSPFWGGVITLWWPTVSELDDAMSEALYMERTGDTYED